MVLSFGKQSLGLIKDQLGKRVSKKHNNPDGRRMNKQHYLAEVFETINEGSWLSKE